MAGIASPLTGIAVPTAESTPRRVLEMLGALLPKGHPLPDDVWRRRHRGIVILLALHIPWLLWYGLVSLGQPVHAVAEVAAVAVATVLASWPRLGRELRMVIASWGLVTCSALLVHFSGGIIEMHFHYFVVVAIVGLYQRWTPYLLAIAYVAVEHGAVGAIDPQAVYDHRDAWLHPWKWAGIHAAFVLAASCVGLITWRLNEALRSRSELILESAGEGICGLDERGNLTFINATGAALLGNEPDNLLGRSWQEVSGDIASHVECTTTPIREQDPGAGIAVLTFKDITERLEAEQAIHALNAELELRVEERTSQLAAANHQLNVANNELEAFSSSVAHDLRAPLRTIDGFSEVLLQRYSADLEEQAKEYLGRVRRASQRMAQLIDDLLNLSRITRVELVREEVDVSASAERVMAELRASEPERECDVSFRPGLSASADPRLLHVALSNLLGNAWKFSSKRPKAIIEFGAMESDRGAPAFFVRDNGAGFDMAYANKLFGAFERLHTEEEFQGTGIGLATVARIVHRHGGDIWCEAAVDEGATFYFTLGGG